MFLPWVRFSEVVELCKQRLLKHLPAFSRNAINPFNVGSIRARPGEEIDYAIDELCQLRSIALGYDDTFSLPTAIVLFRCKKPLLRQITIVVFSL